MSDTSFLSLESEQHSFALKFQPYDPPTKSPTPIFLLLHPLIEALLLQLEVQELVILTVIQEVMSQGMERQLWKKLEETTSTPSKESMNVSDCMLPVV